MKDNGMVVRSLTMISQFTIHMLVPIGICSYLGYLLDEQFDTSFCFVLLFFIGAMAGGRNVYLLAQKTAGGKDKMPSKLYGSNGKRKKQKAAGKKESKQ